MDLNACGVVVAHAAGSKDLCKTVLGELLVHLERMLALPGSISSGLPERHFLRFATSPATAIKEASHRHDFMMPLSPSVEALLRSVVSGSVGASLLATVGQDAKLCELTGIICEPSAASQAVHSDGSWTASGPRLITIFLALHDIVDERMGPTRFYRETHAPHFFPEGHWLPPTAPQVAGRESVWFELHAGDCVLMDQLTWHCGSANTSEQRRILLSISFVAPGEASGSKADTSSSSLCLGDLLELSSKRTVPKFVLLGSACAIARSQ